MRTGFIAAFGLWVLILPTAAGAKSVGSLALSAGLWIRDQAISYAAGKAFDWALGKLHTQKLEQEIPLLISQISTATGPRRVLLQENLDLDREQLALLKRLTASQGKKIAEIQADQDRLLRRIEGLAVRMRQLEGRVGDLEGRVSQLEDAFIRQCLDLRTAEALGADGFLVKESANGWGSDHFEDENLTLDLRLLLNSCTGDLTQRGLLLQLSLVTRDLGNDLSLYANWKGISAYGDTPRLLSRQEIRLARPAYRVDGQVLEIFFPYDEIPGLSATEKVAVALVLTHDGEVLYSLPDRVVSCVFGQRVNCRWGR